MPWNERNRMDESVKFVARLLNGDELSVVCRKFGVSRKTRNKIFNRYKDFGLVGLQVVDVLVEFFPECDLVKLLQNRLLKSLADAIRLRRFNLDPGVIKIVQRQVKLVIVTIGFAAILGAPIRQYAQ